jgi:SAM-dependent methyltransferase
MTVTAPKSSGSAGYWGPLWGLRPESWAKIEEQQVPTYEEAIRRAGIDPGNRVLDIGCGTGVFLRVAADTGADVAGLDGSEALLGIARERLPAADLRAGEMESLPWDDDAFDVVTGFNSLFFADDMVAALREAKRVARPLAPVVIQVWGAPERCGLTAMKKVVAAHRPPPAPGAPDPPRLWEPGVLEGIATAAGLTPGEAFDCSWAYDFADDAALTDGLLSANGISKAITSPEEAVAWALVDALAPFRRADGAYRIPNEWHFLIARA